MDIPLTGNAVLDAEHREMLLYLVQLKDCPPDAMDIVFTFQEYILSHTLREEAFMARVNYPNLLHHLRCHGDLITQSKNLMGGDLYVIDICTAMILQHIGKEDRAFTVWLAEQKDIDTNGM